MTARLLGIMTVVSILMISCISVMPDSSADSEITYLGTFTGGDNESSETAYYTGISCEFSRICGEGDFYVAYGAPIKMDMIQGGYMSAIYPHHDDFGLVGSIIDYPGSEHDVYNNFIEGTAKTGYCRLAWNAEINLDGTIRCLETERSTPVLDLGLYEGEWNLSSEDAVYSGMVGHSGSYHLVDGDQIYVSYGANISLGPRDASEGFICDGGNPLGISSGTARMPKNASTIPT